MEKHYIQGKDLSRNRAEEIVFMLNSIWPPKEKDSSFDERVSRYLAKNKEHDIILFTEAGMIVSHAIVFPRVIDTSVGRMEILALAGVAVQSGYRGRGLGKLIVIEAFSLLKKYNLSLFLFQTGVYSFYKKLGAVSVNNQFVNSCEPEKGEESPWWDEKVMMYPGTASLPEGKIDLLGPGY